MSAPSISSLSIELLYVTSYRHNIWLLLLPYYNGRNNGITKTGPDREPSNHGNGQGIAAPETTCGTLARLNFKMP